MKPQAILSLPKQLDTEIQMLYRGYPPFAVQRNPDGRVGLAPGSMDFRNPHLRHLTSVLPVYYRGDVYDESTDFKDNRVPPTHRG